MKKPQKKYYSILVIALAGLLLASCKTHPSTSETPMKETLSFEVLLAGNHGNLTRENTIINSQDALDEVFKTITSTQEPREEFPEIDFSYYQVGLASMGELSSGGFSLTVDRIEKTEAGVTIYLGGTSPKPGDYVTTVMTSPFILFKFEKQSLPVAFKYAYEK
ncbi:MAG: protease complex subunit PrcB family protein [Altibacter sp.]|uniref:protease complex subunit PrcB family protein n=1 Tax=Altibacter sp. TaxID=2024823 RepID=UPI001D7FDED2|nr:protease complex subunit PrcB family protein [Altibacter sp.]MBZ0326616.1 protease complex subunit PrcB family protein [Altibacter sp.]